MLDERHILLIEKRRDAIRAWLDEAAPYAVHDQRHLDAHTPEQAYWQFGYQAALDDILRLLSTSGSAYDSEGTSSPSEVAVPDAPDSPAG
jgi:hypothetical protein